MPGILGVKQEYTLDGLPVHHTMHTYSFGHKFICKDVNVIVDMNRGQSWQCWAFSDSFELFFLSQND